MNGSVIPGTAIAVDFWQVHKHKGIQFFFLTHLHGDHIVGLTSSWRRPIYCSPLTAQLLLERYGVDKSVLHPLEVGQSHIVYNSGQRSTKSKIVDFGVECTQQLTLLCSRHPQRSCAEGGVSIKGLKSERGQRTSHFSCENPNAKRSNQMSDTENLNSDSLTLVSSESKQKLEKMEVDGDTAKNDCQSEMLCLSPCGSALQQRNEEENLYKPQIHRQGDSLGEHTQSRTTIKCQYVRFSPSRLCFTTNKQENEGKNLGFGESEPEQRHFKIVTSSNSFTETVTFIKNQEGYDEKSETSYMTLTAQPVHKKVRESCSETLTVTVIDANHCPGAVMFLFEGSFGKILYTGDFRFCPEMLKEDSVLFSRIGSIDKVYLDNTYCSPNCVFPTREEALEEILHIVHDHTDCDILLGLRGLGKEELVAAVALAVGEWVCVSPKMLSLATSLGLPNVFKTACPDLRIRVVPFHSVSGKLMREMNMKKRTIAILPTALYQGIDGKPFVNQPDVFVVAYSDHSSYPELIEFVSKLKPASVVPIVRGKVRGPFGLDVSDRENMSCFKPFLSTPVPRQVNSGVQSACFPTIVCSDRTSENRGCLPQSTNTSGHGFEITSVPSFDSLFPDFTQWNTEPTGIKRAKIKRRAKQLHKRSSIMKGVEYLPDEDDSRMSELPQINTEKKPDAENTSAQSNKAPSQCFSGIAIEPCCSEQAIKTNKNKTTDNEPVEDITKSKPSQDSEHVTEKGDAELRRLNLQCSEHALSSGTAKEVEHVHDKSSHLEKNIRHVDSASGGICVKFPTASKTSNLKNFDHEDKVMDCKPDGACLKMSNSSETLNRDSDHIDEVMDQSPSLLGNCETMQTTMSSHSFLEQVRSTCYSQGVSVNPFVRTLPSALLRRGQCEHTRVDPCVAEANVIVIEDSEEFPTQTDSETVFEDRVQSVRKSDMVDSTGQTTLTRFSTDSDSDLPTIGTTEAQSEQNRISKTLSAKQSELSSVEREPTSYLPGSAAQMCSSPRQTTCDTVTSTDSSESPLIENGCPRVLESEDSVSHMLDPTLKEKDSSSVNPSRPILPSTQLSKIQHGSVRVNPLMCTTPSAQLRGGRCAQKRVNAQKPGNDHAFLFSSLRSNNVPHPRALAERGRRLARIFGDVLGKQNDKQ